MSDSFTINNVIISTPTGALCRCGKGKKRPGGGNCHRCHASANVAYRARCQNRKRRRDREMIAVMAARAAELPP